MGASLVVHMHMQCSKIGLKMFKYFFPSFASAAFARSSHSICAGERISQLHEAASLLGESKEECGPLRSPKSCQADKRSKMFSRFKVVQYTVPNFHSFSSLRYSSVMIQNPLCASVKAREYPLWFSCALSPPVLCWLPASFSAFLRFGGSWCFFSSSLAVNALWHGPDNDISGEKGGTQRNWPVPVKMANHHTKPQQHRQRRPANPPARLAFRLQSNKATRRTGPGPTKNNHK